MGDVEIVVADDDPQMRRLLDRFFRRMNAPFPVVCLADGNAAIAYLEGVAAGTRPAPALLVLDENMPGRTGREILRWRRDESGLPSIPTLMLTGGTIASDIDVVLDATYLQKPVTYEHFVQVITELGVVES